MQRSMTSPEPIASSDASDDASSDVSANQPALSASSHAVSTSAAQTDAAETGSAASIIPIYTIGYGARALDAFLDVLQQIGIDYLIDVRSAPYSRYRPEFSQKPLMAALAQAGIRYVFMGDLLGGQPKDEACYCDGKVDDERSETHRAGTDAACTHPSQVRFRLR